VLVRLNVLLIATILACFATLSRADVVVRVEVKVKDPNQKADANPALSVETLAGTTGQFSSKTTVGKQTIELKGDLKRGDDGQYRVRVSFSDLAEGSVQQVTTNIILPPNKPREIGGLVGADGQRSVVLALDDKPAK